MGNFNERRHVSVPIVGIHSLAMLVYAVPIATGAQGGGRSDGRLSARRREPSRSELGGGRDDGHHSPVTETHRWRC